jgi:hypothetical protein
MKLNIKFGIKEFETMPTIKDDDFMVLLILSFIGYQSFFFKFASFFIKHLKIFKHMDIKNNIFSTSN